MSEPALLVESATITADGRSILQVERLEVRPGHFVGVLGANGAGKSTLLRLLLGFVRPATGRVSVLGEQVAPRRWGSLCSLRRRLGYVPQGLADAPAGPLTLREVVAVGRTGRVGLGRGLSRDDWGLVDGWIDRLGLAGVARQRYGDCSGGERRKALIARAMAQEPNLLLLDEPAANLDLAGREQVVEALQQAYEQTGVTAMLVCHEPEVLPPCCDRALLIEGGRLTADGSPAEVISGACVQRLYGPSLRVLHVGGRHAVVPADREASHGL